jgi:hypothetical protein
MSEDTHEADKHGHVAGPNPQDRSEGMAAAIQAWRCVCGRINPMTQMHCAVCGETYAQQFIIGTSESDPTPNK